MSRSTTRSPGTARRGDQANIQSSDSTRPTIPTIISEFCNATDGSHVDPNGIQLVQNVLDNAPKLYSGYAAWIYYWPVAGGGTPGSEADNLGNENTGQLTNYGQQVAAAISGANAPTPAGGAAPVSPDSLRSVQLRPNVRPDGHQ